MMKRYVLFLLIFLLCFTFASFSYAVTGETIDDKVVFSLIEEAKKKIKSINDYTCTFYKQEFVDGKLLPQEVIEFKFKKPHAVYMKWVGNEHRGREIIYRKGWNDNKMKAHEGSWLLSKFVVDLEPESKMAMKGNRHSVAEADFGNIIDKLSRNARLARSAPECHIKVVDMGKQIVQGYESQCFMTEIPKDKCPQFYAYKVLMCFEPREFYLTKMRVWDFEDGEMRLVESYEYGNIKINVGLTNWDFDPANPSYKF